MNNPFRCFKTSPEIVRLAVMMYIRYPLSLRQVEDILFERGIDICHETVRYWWNRFGPLFAGEIRNRRIKERNYSNWRWHLDEVFVWINGERHYLWRAVDHGGEVLEAFVIKRRDRRAALKFLKRTIKRYGRPWSIVTDRIPSYRAAMKGLGNSGWQECGRQLNNRAKNSHLPFRRWEGAMARFRDIKTLQKFTAAHSSIYNHFNYERHFNRRDMFKTPGNRLGRVAPTGGLVIARDREFNGLGPVTLTALRGVRLSPMHRSLRAVLGASSARDVASVSTDGVSCRLEPDAVVCILERLRLDPFRSVRPWDFGVVCWPDNESINEVTLCRNGYTRRPKQARWNLSKKRRSPERTNCRR